MKHAGEGGVGLAAAELSGRGFMFWGAKGKKYSQHLSIKHRNNGPKSISLALDGGLYLLLRRNGYSQSVDEETW